MYTTRCSGLIEVDEGQLSSEQTLYRLVSPTINLPATYCLLNPTW